jgi:hypothetical protein
MKWESENLLIPLLSKLIQYTMRKSLQFFTSGLLAFFLIIAAVNGQEAVVSAGNFHENENLSISWSLGEVAIETFVAGDLVLTQGFQQPTITVVSVEDLPGFDLQVKAFPNPATDILNILIENANEQTVSFRLYDMSGRVLISDKMHSLSRQLSFSEYESGVYFLQMQLEGEPAKIFKIVKK